MEDYEEIKLEKYREVVVFSFCFLSFLSGELFFTKEFCGFVKIRQEKIKYRTTWFDDGWTYQEYWTRWKFKWIKI